MPGGPLGSPDDEGSLGDAKLFRGGAAGDFPAGPSVVDEVERFRAL